MKISSHEWTDSIRPGIGLVRGVSIALLMGAGGSFAQDQKPATELGKLFFTPQQRQELDRRRELNIQEATVVIESLYTVNGHISRSSGKTTTWINGTAQHETYKPLDPTNVALQPVEDEPPIVLKVGQTLDKNSGTIRDGIAGGEITVKKSAPGTRSR
jgi:hypothetical protein